MGATEAGVKAMSGKLVSIVFTAFNEEEYIGAGVASALAQEHGNLEVIVVDDGSTDRTPEILAAIKDRRLRVVRQTNAGTFVARNRGVAEARGDYIAVHDADDLMTPTRIERQAAFLESTPSIDAVGTQVALFAGQMRRAVPLWHYPTDSATLRNLLCGEFSARPFICFASFMFRAEAMKKRMPFYPEDVRLSGDWIAFRRHSDELRFANLDSVEYFFRVCGDTALLKKNIWQYRYVRYYNQGDVQGKRLSMEEFKSRPELIPFLTRAAWDAKTLWGWLKFKGRLTQIRLVSALGRGILLPECR